MRLAGGTHGRGAESYNVRIRTNDAAVGIAEKTRQIGLSMDPVDVATEQRTT
jgi:hypothetical protein